MSAFEMLAFLRFIRFHNFSKDNNIGTYSNFYKYIKKHKLKPKKNKKAHLRFETDMGKQLQFDWKENIFKLINISIIIHKLCLIIFERM